MKPETCDERYLEMTSRPARGAWIEMSDWACLSMRVPSRPARGAWIETTVSMELRLRTFVAPRTGRVD